MSIRATAAAQSLERTANLPSVSSYSMCAWGRMLVDRNDFQTWWTIENTQFEGMGADNDGTTFQFFSNLNAINIDTLVANRWFWFGVSRNGTAVRIVYIPQPGAAVQSFTGTVVNMLVTPTSMNALNDHARDSFVNGDGMAYKLWDAVLGDDELIQEAYTLRPKRTANLNLWTPMVHNTVANSALDLSGNGRNWTVVSTPSIDDNAPVSWGGRSALVQSPGAVTIAVAGSSQAAEPASAPVNATAAVAGASQAVEPAAAPVNATIAQAGSSQAAEPANAPTRMLADGAAQAPEQASAPVVATAAVVGSSQAVEPASAGTNALFSAAGASQAANQASAGAAATAAVDGASQALGPAAAAVNALTPADGASQAVGQAAAPVNATVAVDGASQATEQAAAPVNATAAVDGFSQAPEQAFAVTDAGITISAAGASQAAGQASATVNATVAVDGSSAVPEQASAPIGIVQPSADDGQLIDGPDPYDRTAEYDLEEIIRREDEEIIEMAVALVTSGALEWA